MSAAEDAETTALVRAFEEGTLGGLPHAAHVRVAWSYARSWPLLDAIARMRDGLLRFTAAKGAREKYHETITWAFVVLIHERIAADPAATWSAFAKANPDLFEPEALRRHYSAETLATPLARRVFVLPR